MTLDPHLHDLAINKNEYYEKLPWEDLYSRCQQKLSTVYSMSLNGKEAVIKKGSLEPILVNVQRRSSNKKVSFVFTN